MTERNEDERRHYQLIRVRSRTSDNLEDGKLWNILNGRHDVDGARQDLKEALKDNPSHDQPQKGRARLQPDAPLDH